jgi:hypothetical protein
MRNTSFVMIGLVAVVSTSACGGTSTQPQDPSVTAAEGNPAGKNQDNTDQSNAATGPTPKAIDGPSPPATDGMTPPSK